MGEVYITKIAKYFPNSPVSNAEMEEYLGLINERHSKTKGVVLRNNLIKNRYYALNKKSELTHSNAQIAAESVRALFKENPEEIKEVDLLACGTSSPDQMFPSHGVMTHGELTEMRTIEVVSPAGVCCAGMHAMKYAYLSVKAEERKKAVALGSERFSAFLRADKFKEEAVHLEELEKDPIIAFEKDFLRWMLSDGSGAVLLENKKADKGFSFKIEWIEGVSYANEFETCMYSGAVKNEDTSLTGYLDMTNEQMLDSSALSIKQDVTLLSENILGLGFKRLKEIFDEKGLTADDIDYMLPHISSFYFKDKIYDIFKNNGMEITWDKWFINLDKVGNVGAASIYLMLEEIQKNGTLKLGDKILLVVPESSRFSYMFAWLTVC